MSTDYYDDPQNVDSYIRMADGYDGRMLVAVLQNYLLPGASVLELGMGPGKDLDLLNKTFVATGSDRSKVFLDLYRRDHPGARLLQLDAFTLRTRKTFDAIYSNKVLHHLTTRQLARSFERQYGLLHEEGLALHSFWIGEGEGQQDGLRYVLYQESDVIEIAHEVFEVVEVGRYKELTDDDSFYIVFRKRPD